MAYRHASSLRKHLKVHREMKDKYKKLSFPRLVSLKRRIHGDVFKSKNKVSKMGILSNTESAVKSSEKTMLFVIDESDPNMWVLGSEETHNLHQTVFESLARSGHDYTEGEEESDSCGFLSLSNSNTKNYMAAGQHQRKMNEYDDLHNYALCSEAVWDSTNNGLFPEVACIDSQSVSNVHEVSSTTDHGSYSSSKYG